MNKSQIRQILLQKRSTMTASEKAFANQKILNKLVSFPKWKQSPSIAIYLSLPNEVDTFALIKEGFLQGKYFSAPVIDWPKRQLTFHNFNTLSSLVSGPKGILEPQGQLPCDLSKINLFIVPGLGFDLEGYRIGYGAGLYDRALKNSGVYKIGLGFDFQIIPKLPREKWDIPMDCIITEKRIILKTP